MAVKGGFSPKTARLVFFVRDGEACVRCGRGLRWEDRGVGWSMHHRRPRGMGGDTSSEVSSPANALTLCGSGTTGCHGWVEQHRDEAFEAGWLVPKLGELNDPRDVPVMHHGVEKWLTDWGSAAEFGPAWKVGDSGGEQETDHRRDVSADGR